MSGFILNNKELSNVSFDKPLLYVDSLGNPTTNKFPNVLGNKLYTEPYMRLNNALPISCPEKWSFGYDDVPAANDGNIKFGKSISTGLPVCKKGKDVCFPQEISLMGQNMFSGRKGFLKCPNNKNGVSYLKGKQYNNISNVEDAKKMCDNNIKCQGFVSSNRNRGVHFKFINNGIESNIRSKNIIDTSKVKLLGGTKFTTYIKNTSDSHYTPHPIGQYINVSKKDLGLIENFMNKCSVNKNIGMLVSVLLIILVVFFLKL